MEPIPLRNFSGTVRLCGMIYELYAESYENIHFESFVHLVEIIVFYLFQYGIIFRCAFNENIVFIWNSLFMFVQKQQQQQQLCTSRFL